MDGRLGPWVRGRFGAVARTQWRHRKPITSQQQRWGDAGSLRRERWHMYVLAAPPLEGASRLECEEHPFSFLPGGNNTFGVGGKGHFLPRARTNDGVHVYCCGSGRSTCVWPSSGVQHLPCGSYELN